MGPLEAPWRHNFILQNEIVEKCVYIYIYIYISFCKMTPARDPNIYIYIYIYITISYCKKRLCLHGSPGGPMKAQFHFAKWNCGEMCLYIYIYMAVYILFPGRQFKGGGPGPWRDPHNPHNTRDIHVYLHIHKWTCGRTVHLTAMATSSTSQHLDWLCADCPLSGRFWLIAKAMPRQFCTLLMSCKVRQICNECLRFYIS